MRKMNAKDQLDTRGGRSNQGPWMVRRSVLESVRFVATFLLIALLGARASCSDFDPSAQGIVTSPPAQGTAPREEISAPSADSAGDPASAFDAELAPYGQWMELNGQKYWQPNEAALGGKWRPYADGGHWVFTDAGWTWDSQYSWGWGPFHYGRWLDDSVLGWLWAPGSEWAPAWVVWRGDDTMCGWAPLPPGSEFKIDIGFRFHGLSVSLDFDFGVGADDYFFINISNMGQPSYSTCRIPAAQSDAVFSRTAVVQNAYQARDGKVVNAGVGVDRVRALTRREIKPLPMVDAQSTRENGRKGDTLAVYRIKTASAQTTPPAQGGLRTDQIMNDLLAISVSGAKPSQTPAGGSRPSPGQPVREAAPGFDGVMAKLLAMNEVRPAHKVESVLRPEDEPGHRSVPSVTQNGGFDRSAHTSHPAQPERGTGQSQAYQPTQPFPQRGGEAGGTGIQAQAPDKNFEQLQRQAEQQRRLEQQRQADQERERRAEQQRQVADEHQTRADEQRILQEERQQRAEEQRIIQEERLRRAEEQAEHQRRAQEEAERRHESQTKKPKY